jgi:hypothetical protein
MATQETGFMGTWNESAMMGREMFTMVASRDAIKEESAMMNRTSFCSLPLRGSRSSI